MAASLIAGGKGVKSSLREAVRVLRSGGEFWMMVAKGLWLRVATGPLLLHRGMRGPEQGRQPATLYFLGLEL